MVHGEFDALPTIREVSDPYLWAKDGRQHFYGLSPDDPDAGIYARLMRK